MIKLDHNAFHAYLYRKADQHGIIRIPISKLAKHLEVPEIHISKILRIFCATNRAERVAQGTYRIQPPEAPDPNPRNLMWQ